MNKIKTGWLQDVITHCCLTFQRLHISVVYLWIHWEGRELVSDNFKWFIEKVPKLTYICHRTKCLKGFKYLIPIEVKLLHFILVIDFLLTFDSWINSMTFLQVMPIREHKIPIYKMKKSMFQVFKNVQCLSPLDFSANL